MSAQTKQALQQTLSGPTFKKRMMRRRLKDHTAKYGISVGGVGIIFAVFLIMFFLLYVVLPMFVPATMEKRNAFALPGGVEDRSVYYAVDDYKEVAVRLTESGRILGINLRNGETLLDQQVPSGGAKVTSFTIANEPNNVFAYGLSNGQVLVGQIKMQVTYPNDVRTITPVLEWPFGDEPVKLLDEPVSQLAVRDSESRMMLVAKPEHTKTVSIRTYSKTSSFLTETTELEDEGQSNVALDFDADHILLGGRMRDLVLVSNQGHAEYYSIADIQNPTRIQAFEITRPGETITAARFLTGNYSMMFGTSQGRILQWFPVRDENNDFSIKQIREFQRGESPIVSIGIEDARKGFAVGDESGTFNLYHSTAHRHLRSMQVADDPLTMIRISPRANGAVVETAAGELVVYDIKNNHPEVSMESIWSKVWYEGYEEPTHTWQSSSGTSDFEPKFSLTPLTFGTIKAALYSMLFAVPIAIFAAMYTAFFMDKKTRQWIKPSVELIEALPTVILGFLAGLWLAPYMEANLPGFFAIVVIVPLGIIAFGLLWSRLPEKWQLSVPVGRRAILMLPVIAFLGWLSLSLSSPLEAAFFNGDMRSWLTESAGIDFDQRNAMVIGFAMGFALIPTIFSVAEDAIYSVPSYLVNGSYALGASGWQTLTGVVLPTASPGIFSAIMLGFGRGVGETMIVLMASGNTPLMDVNLFEGMRTLSANLAVEMGETEVDSTHYRVLFLAGLVLFIFTFFFNTLAEVVRQRMRRKYGSL
ncbi:ABC transporter permease subunit [Thiomicrospira sp.]|uniref:ABC transporter permease subunit n=1 Tax=Thiomicrospira sp. TaxID=935 RepID=UPI002F93B698